MSAAHLRKNKLDFTTGYAACQDSVWHLVPQRSSLGAVLTDGCSHFTHRTKMAKKIYLQWICICICFQFDLPRRFIYKNFLLWDDTLCDKWTLRYQCLTRQKFLLLLVLALVYILADQNCSDGCSPKRYNRLLSCCRWRIPDNYGGWSSFTVQSLISLYLYCYGKVRSNLQEGNLQTFRMVLKTLPWNTDQHCDSSNLSWRHVDPHWPLSIASSMPTEFDDWYLLQSGI